MKKVRMLVEEYNKAVEAKDLEGMKKCNELLDDQRAWEHKEWNKGFNIGYASAVVGMILGVVMVKVLEG